MQSTVEWGSESSEVGVGTEAYVRFSATCGYVKVAWKFDWVGDVEPDIAAPTALQHTCVLNTDDPAAVVVVVTLVPLRLADEVDQIVVLDVESKRTGPWTVR